jgi:hypothetical protein
MSENPFVNPFKKIGDDLQKGFKKMQDDFNKFFGIAPQQNLNQGSPQAPPQSTGATSIPAENDNTTKTFPAESSQNVNAQNSNQSIVPASNPPTSMNAFQQNWDNFVKMTQQNFQKWQQDTDTFIKQKQEEAKARNAKMQAKVNEAGQNFKKFFENSQAEFNTKIKAMEQDIKTKDMERKENVQKTMQVMSESWNNMMTQQKESAKHFEKMSNRLWWKGYVNFLLWILLIVFIFTGVMWIFQQIGFDITQFAPTK